jgi:hypothetical protein
VASFFAFQRFRTGLGDHWLHVVAPPELGMEFKPKIMTKE